MRPYEKAIEYCKAMLFYGKYQSIRPKVEVAPLMMLDNVNFSSQVVEDPLPIVELFSLFEIEPGYGTVTGDCEIGSTIRELEYARALNYAKAYGIRSEVELREVINGAVAITTSGATGAANTILTAAMLRNRAGHESQRNEVVFNTPCYCLPEGFSHLHALTPRAISGDRESSFLPSLEAIQHSVGTNTLACFLTFPTNPFLQCWSSDDVPALRKLILHCQDFGVVLVVDSVFQDLRWGSEPAPEIFALARSPALIAKLHSPSKDRPFACGHRIGFVLADASLEYWLCQSEALTKNSSSTQAQVWLAFDSVFRIAMLEGKLKLEHFKLLEDKYLFGYGAPKLTASDMYDKVQSAGIFTRYMKRIDRFRKEVLTQLRQLHGWLARSECFVPAPLPAFGNLLTVQVRSPFDLGTEDDFFLETLIATNVTSTVGGCFGMPMDQGVWIRVAAGSAPVDLIIDALTRLQNYLLWRAGASTDLARPSQPTKQDAGQYDENPIALSNHQVLPQSEVNMADPACDDSGRRIASWEMGDSCIKLFWQGGETSTVNYLWLRDNCPCGFCRHPQAMERTFNLLSVPPDIHASAISLTDTGALRVDWPGGDTHVSLFDSGWLSKNCTPGNNGHREPRRQLWGAELRGAIPSLRYRDIMDTNQAVLQWCRWLQQYGVTIIRDVPLESGEVVRVGQRIGHVWTHYYGNVFDVLDKPNTDSTAYTALSLPAHNDLPSRISQPGFQLLHCLENSVDGGELSIMDGFKIAATLRSEEPDVYQTLCDVPVEFRFVSPTVDYQFQGPIIEHDRTGAIRSVRFNDFLRSPFRLASERMEEVYGAYRRFLAMTTQEAFRIHIRYQPGDLVSLDNQRLLHARRSFDPNSGRRHLQGCYLDRDELLSRIRVIESSFSH